MSNSAFSQVLDELAPWKRRRFQETELSWVRAAESLGTDDPLIEARPDGRFGRWRIFDKATGKLAVFYHAAVWAWASPPETGNYVPNGEVAPRGVLVNRISSRLEKKAEISYAFNTWYDPSFYDAARLVEDHVVSHDDFNKHKKRRRSWQTGETLDSRRRFVFASRLCIRRTPYNTKDIKIPYKSRYKLHPWLDAAFNAQDNPYWVPNPDRPRIIDYVNGKLETIEPTTNQYFESGDIVWFSFVLTFEFNPNDWSPEFKPLNFVRVGRLSESPEQSGEYSLDDEVGDVYQPLTEGNVSLLEDDGPSVKRGNKRRRDSDGDDTMSDGGMSNKSAYSAALEALEEGRKKAKTAYTTDDPSISGSKPLSKGDEIPKRRANVKTKGK